MQVKNEKTKEFTTEMDLFLDQLDGNTGSSHKLIFLLHQANDSLAHRLFYYLIILLKVAKHANHFFIITDENFIRRRTDKNQLGDKKKIQSHFNYAPTENALN